MGTNNPAEEGYNANAIGKLPKDNPYKEGTPDYDAWERGWLEFENNCSEQIERQ